jgi:flagellar hook protein FlgE
MSLYGMMRTGVSGMNAQANRLSTVADNIANSSTTGYKRASTEFSSLVIPSSGGNYTSGGVNTAVRNSISQQGDLKFTTSRSDLAVNGDGFFVVQDANGATYLTRSGSFVPDAEGRLVNAAGYYLTGYSFNNGTPSPVANGFGGLEVVQISDTELTASPSRNGTFTANLPVDAAAVTGNRPSDNAANSAYSEKSSLVVYDNVGREVVLDIYFTKTSANTWEVTVFNQADAAASTAFPYMAPYLANGTLSFDPTNGQLATGGSFSIPVLGGQTLTLDLSKMTELGTNYTVLDPDVDGNAPNGIESIQIDDDGTLYAQYENGSFKELYRIPLATVQSPDQLSVLPGNVYSQSSDSGDIRIGFPNESGMGSVISGALENSTVDIAEELTNMIESQRSYTANSKVFQTGADLMDVLVNLKR